ncbi:MAG: branched-chain amino acid ABC transporter ATP-binding protein/permease [Nitrospira sp.]|nr:branched-chain amino acid ABC transporter ATP-binding protein/permease [Nitrospira sp.]
MPFKYLFLLLALFIGSLPLFIHNPYYLSILVFIGISTILTVGLCLVMGYAGQISLGQAAFYGIGSYASAILTVKYGLSAWIALVLGGILTGLIAYGIGIPIFRLREHYLAVATLGLGVIVHLAFVEFDQWTGGPSGFPGIPRLSILGFTLKRDVDYFYVVWGITLLILFLSQNIVQSRIGRALRSIHDSEIAAEMVGVHIAHYKKQVFALSAIYASIAGSLHAHYLTFISPSDFGLLVSIELVIMASVGGLASIWGAIFGASAITGLTEILRSVMTRWLNNASDEYEILAYGLILMVTMIFMPDGLVVGIQRSLQKMVKRQKISMGAWKYGSLGEHGTSFPYSHAPTLLHSHTPILEVHGISKAFGGILAVDHVDLNILQNSIMALIGPNGAGKTTLFNLISGVYRPDEGEIRFNQQSLQRVPPHAYASLGIARTFQNVQLFGRMTVLENVLLGYHHQGSYGFFPAILALPRTRVEEQELFHKALQLLAQVGLESKAFDRASDLPFGQQRLLELARALAVNPKLLLLDESGSGLNKTEKVHLVKLISELRAKGMTLLLVEHDMEFVMSLADWVVVLNYGKKLAEGTPQEVQKNEQVVQAYLGEESGI